VTKLAGKPARWNEINPASEKPKFGRGTADARKEVQGRYFGTDK
jgi:hypothetical protein